MPTTRRRILAPRRLPRPEEREELIAFLVGDEKFFRRAMGLHAWEDTPIALDGVACDHQQEIDSARACLLDQIAVLGGFTHEALRAGDPAAERKLDDLYRRLGLDPKRHIHEKGKEEEGS